MTGASPVCGIVGVALAVSCCCVVLPTPLWPAPWVAAPSPHRPGPKASQWLHPAGLSGALRKEPPVSSGRSMKPELLLSALEEGLGILAFWDR